MGYKTKFIVKINPNTGVRKDDYIIDSTYGLCRALGDSSGGRYNQVTVITIPKREKKTIHVFTGGGLYKISMKGEGIGSGIDYKKVVQYLFKN